MIIATEFYMPKSEARLEEIVEAIGRNDDVAEKLLLYINSSERESVSFAKKYLNFKNVWQIHLPERQTFGSIFRSTWGEGGTVAVCNNDISFTQEAADIINNDDMENKFLCLTRWDKGQLKMPATSRKFSQDAWVFKPPFMSQQMIDSSQFYFGLPGCDNRVAFNAVVAGMNVLNPCEIVRIDHHHSSDERNYKRNSRGTPAKSEKIGQPSVYMNVVTSNSMEYNSDNLLYKRQQSWKHDVYQGGDAVKEACHEFFT
tara:strand:- start:9384 stop:10154 length:771 start_codon:yes stop_codon:yes gene_type:complete